MVTTKLMKQYISHSIPGKSGCIGMRYTGTQLFASGDFAHILQHHWMDGKVKPSESTEGYMVIYNPSARDIGTAMLMLSAMEGGS